MDCLLSEEEINNAWVSETFSSDLYIDIVGHACNVCKAQLQSPKLKAYIDGLVQAEKALIMERYFEGFMTLHHNVDRPGEESINTPLDTDLFGKES